MPNILCTASLSTGVGICNMQFIKDGLRLVTFLSVMSPRNSIFSTAIVHFSGLNVRPAPPAARSTELRRSLCSSMDAPQISTSSTYPLTPEISSKISFNVLWKVLKQMLYQRVSAITGNGRMVLRRYKFWRFLHLEGSGEIQSLHPGARTLSRR